MQWDYESICWVEKNNKDNSPLFKTLNCGLSVMKRYVMWLWLNEIEFDLTLENRAKYLKECYLESSTDFILDMLKSDIDKEEQAILIAFYYLKDDEIKELHELLVKAKNQVKELYEEMKVNYHKQEKNLLEQLRDPDYIKKIVNISFALDIKLISYISFMDNCNMSLHYQSNRGVILSLGYEFELDKNVDQYNHIDTLDKLKALGDETRLRILELIKENPLSASELSLLLNLTIPTIAHHLKVLGSNEIICTCIENEGGSKVTYNIYNTGIDKLVKNLSILSSGVIK